MSIDYEFDDDLLRSCIETWGRTLQTTLAIEEMSELTKVLAKDIRGYHCVENVAEEIADVLIMIHQMMLMFDIPDDVVREQMDVKITRVRERLAKSRAKILPDIPL